MPNLDSRPRPDSIEKFLEYLGTHTKVQLATRRGASYCVDVSLDSGDTVLVHMTNIYVVGAADVVQVLRDQPDVHLIVTLSMWNMVSNDARTLGRDRKVGVFAFNEFFGALHYKKYWLYEPLPLDIKGPELARERQRRRREWN